ncbi:hypothetical protein [Treponema endosymbiont of Eucomonympha sp.]|uniref:hypothetical protein n=1 Tax=Treponema endosymbiont of Eucomonympha sp. TaxID=1580831 RepID=UPI000ACC97BE|nr:hypothetical protein [Treponema endosymbiont of Eucomonympha sp.]
MQSKLAAYGHSIRANSLYRIEITDMRAKKDAPRIRVFARLTGFYESLIKFFA